MRKSLISLSQSSARSKVHWFIKCELQKFYENARILKNFVLSCCNFEKILQLHRTHSNSVKIIHRTDLKLIKIVFIQFHHFFAYMAMRIHFWDSSFIGDRAKLLWRSVYHYKLLRISFSSHIFSCPFTRDPSFFLRGGILSISFKQNLFGYQKAFSFWWTLSRENYDFCRI